MTEVVVVRDRRLLCEAVAARLITRLVDVQAAGRQANLLVAADPVTRDVLDAVADSRARDAVDPAALRVWWADHDVTSSQATPLDGAALPGKPGFSDFSRDDAEAVAGAYADALLQAREPTDHGPVPAFDVAVLGLHDDGGVAGLAPESPAVHDERAVVAVGTVDRPQVALGLTALAAAHEVWLLATGRDAAPAVHLALTHAGPLQVPAAALHGQVRTLLLVDEAAAARIPTGLRRIASP